MSRLIDADVLLEYIKKLECYADNKKYEKGLNDFLQFYFPQIIDNQPTAFDTEKVVNQLEEINMNYFSPIANTGSEKLDIAYGYVSDSINKAIDIVKKGGVE